MKELILKNGSNSQSIMVFEQSDHIDCRVLEENTAESHTVPAGAKFVRISVDHGTAVFVKFGGTAAIPTGDVTNGSASEVITPSMQPVVFSIGSATAIGLIAPEYARVTLVFYK